ncbi:MAG: class I SAM-dependent methyltransferase [Flavobacteriales bacterium]|nr:class I SAM-dependent methyltransferase [Flavobacteriales bacterium]
MSQRLTRKQTTIVIGIPMFIGALSLALYSWAGPVALVAPPVLIGIFVAFLIVELRHYQMGLFIRELRETQAVYAQTEAVLSLVWTLDPKMPFPATRGWAASPDLLREILRQVMAEPPALVVEASSGTSTLVIAYALERLGKGKVVALEHEQFFAEKTRSLIDEHGLSHRATVVHAPLVETQVDGKKHLWYDLSRAELGTGIDLLVVDGPPDTTQHLARYPAVPLLKEKFAPGARVLLDDGARPDERLTAERWTQEYGATSCEYLELEKGAWLLRYR